MHGPCGSMSPKSACVVDGVCSKGRTKRFRIETIEVDGFPEYRRPGDGRSILKNGVILANQWVVPHNPWIRAKYNAHISAEVRSTLAAVKYLYKYAYKGADRAVVEVGTGEIQSYRD